MAMNRLKSIFCVTLLLLAVVSNTFAKDNASDTKILSDKSGPRVEFESTIKDFGEVAPKSVHEFEYRFKNVGDKPLVVSYVQSTCGCTIPSLSKKEYAPGEKGVIKVKYTASSRAGKVTKKVYFHSNDIVNPRYGLVIKSHTVLKVTIEPQKIELSLTAPNCGMVPIKVRSKDGKDFSVLSVDGPVAGLVSVDLGGSRAANEIILNPVVDVKKLEKHLNGVIRVKINHPDCKAVTLIYNTKPKFSISPARILFLKAEPGQSEQREIMIKSNYSDKIEIGSIVSKNGLISVVGKEVNGSIANLKVVIKAPENMKQQRFFTDSLLVKLLDGEELEIKCNGWFKKELFKKMK